MTAIKPQGTVNLMMKGAIAVLIMGALVSLGLADVWALAMVSLLATLAGLAIFVFLHILPTGYDPISQAASDYAVGRFGYLSRSYLRFISIGILALALCLAVEVKPPLPVMVLAYLGLVALGYIAASLFPTDLEGERLTRTGAIHYALAFLNFTFITLAIENLTPTLVTLRPWQPAALPLTWLAWAAVPAVMLVLITLLKPLRRVFGLFERLFLLTAYLWLALVALSLII